MNMFIGIKQKTRNTQITVFSKYHTMFFSMFFKISNKILTFVSSQVRRSFLEELGVVDNWTLVDMLFREFYTGSDTDLVSNTYSVSTAQKRLTVKSVMIVFFWFLALINIALNYLIKCSLNLSGFMPKNDQ
jgi:hypothetical protein